MLAQQLLMNDMASCAGLMLWPQRLSQLEQAHPKACQQKGAACKPRCEGEACLAKSFARVRRIMQAVLMSANQVRGNRLEPSRRRRRAPGNCTAGGGRRRGAPLRPAAGRRGCSPCWQTHTCSWTAAARCTPQQQSAHTRHCPVERAILTGQLESRP